MADAFMPFTTGAPAIVQDFHARPGTWVGNVEAVPGTGALTWLLLRLGGFPTRATIAEATVETAHTATRSRWTRNFGGHIMTSELRQQPDGRIGEAFGPFVVEMSARSDGDGLEVSITGLRVLGVPVPRVLLPRSETRESEAPDGTFAFDVAGFAPWGGLLIRYSGTLSRIETP